MVARSPRGGCFLRAEYDGAAGAPVPLPPRYEQGPAARGPVSRQARLRAHRPLRLARRKLALVRGGNVLGGPRQDRLPLATRGGRARGRERRTATRSLGCAA